MGRINLRLKVFLGLVAAVVAVAMFIAACGSDNGNGPEVCTGPSCDGGTPESSTKDSPSGDDGNIPPTDGGRDADADSSFAESCDGGGEPGTLDTTFGDGGIVWLSYPGSGAYAVVVQADGKIVVGGYTATHAAVARLLVDGTLDTTFGASGLAETKPGDSSNFYNSVAVQADGKIVAAGSAGFNARAPDFAVVRYLPNGGLDPAFGTAGVVLTDFGSRDDYAQSVVVQADGHIVVSGYSELNAVTSTSDYAVARYNADGSLDATFGNGGKVLIDVHGTADAPGVGAVLGAGGVVVGGASAETTSATSVNDFSAAQLKADGTRDPSFGDAGVFLRSYGSSPLYPGAGAIAIDGSGRIVLCGTVPGNGTDFGLVRLTSVGVLDLTFGDGGVVATDFGGRSDSCASLLVQGDGKIVGVGLSILGSGTGNVALARYLSNGAVDPAFGTTGRVLSAPPANADLGAAAAALSGCHVIAVGPWSYNENVATQTAMGIARYRR